MFHLRHYDWCLFIWHLVIEKALKAKIVSLDREIPVTHNLVRLAREAEFELSEESSREFEEVTAYNVEARYDDYKRSFYRKATPEYTKDWVVKCERLYLWIRERIAPS